MFSNPQTIIQQLPLIQGMTVVDLGAGTGAYSLVCAKKVGSSGKVYAVEVQRNLVDHLQQTARTTRLPITVLWGDIEHLHGTKLRDGLADMVVIANTLFQVVHKDVTLQEAKRLLKKNGILVIIDWSESHGGLGPQPEQVLTASAAEQLLTRNGFTFTQRIDAGAHHYGILGRHES